MPKCCACVDFVSDKKYVHVKIIGNFVAALDYNYSDVVVHHGYYRFVFHFHISFPLIFVPTFGPFPSVFASYRAHKDKTSVMK